jgi:D-alanyl-D-alanine carboxypeptidase
MFVRKISSACLIVLAAAVVCGARQGADAPQLPETPTGRRVAAYLKAFNSGEEAAMRAFFNEHAAAASLERRPVEARLAAYREMRGEIGRLELRRVLAASDTSVRVLAQGRGGGWLELGFEFEAQPPHMLVGLRVEESSPEEAGANLPATLSEADALKRAAELVEGVVRADEFSGVVLVAKNGQPVMRNAYGLASREYNVPNRTDTKFNLGSINKVFTQVAVGQLAEQGKLSFDDTLGKHLPDYPNRQAAEKVTIRQLLSMSSGIGDFFGAKYDATPKDRLRKLSDFLPLFAAEPLQFEPGTQRRYSNGGYIVLGAIIEKVTGQSYYDYVREHVFKPAGMTDTEYYEADQATPNLASGYTREGATAGARRNNFYTRPARGTSAGGGYSTAEDLLRFAQALQTGKLRLPNFRAPAGGGQQAGLSGGGFAGIGVAGGAAGINAVLEVEPTPDGYTLVVLSNYDPPSAQKLGRQLRAVFERVKR